MPSRDFVPSALSRTFTQFIDSEKSGAIVLMVCTVICLIIANSAFGPACFDFWHLRDAGLMAIPMASVSAGVLGMSWLTVMTPHFRNGNKPA